jgi:hypothetical protein
MKYKKQTNGINTGVKEIVRDVEDVLDKVKYRSEFRQFNRKNNVKVAHLYALYLSGKSLRYIAEVMYQGRFTHQALADVFRVRGYKLRTKKLKPARIYKGVEYRPAHGGYRSRVGGKTVYLHKLIWEEHNGKIPPDHYIIFKDSNHENIVIENLICILSIDAKKQYNYSNQFGYKRFEGRGAFGI